jgi:hypothetical protein
MLTTKGNETAGREQADAKDVKLWAAGDRSVAALRGNGIDWLCDLGGDNKWRRRFPLPHGVSPGDVAQLGTSRDGVTLVTRWADMLIGDARDGTWAPPTNVFADGAR